MVRITESAVRAILNIMARKGLDNTEYALDLRIIDGIAGVGFTREKDGIVRMFHDLTVNIDPRVMQQDMYLDFGEVDGKQGIIFKEK